MLDTSNLPKFLKGITDAIRAKKGTTEPIEHKLIDEEIASIQSDEIKLFNYYIGTGGFNFSDLEVEHLIIELPNYVGNTTILKPDKINSLTKEITLKLSSDINSMERLIYGSVWNRSVKTLNLDFNTSKVTSFRQAINYFLYCETINGVFDFSEATNVTLIFNGMNSLVDVRFAKETLKLSISISSAYLSDESIQSIIDGLAYVTTTQTLTLHTDVKARLTEEQIATIYEKGWTLA